MEVIEFAPRAILPDPHASAGEGFAFVCWMYQHRRQGALWANPKYASFWPGYAAQLWRRIQRNARR